MRRVRRHDDDRDVVLRLTRASNPPALRDHWGERGAPAETRTHCDPILVERLSAATGRTARRRRASLLERTVGTACRRHLTSGDGVWNLWSDPGRGAPTSCGSAIRSRPHDRCHDASRAERSRHLPGRRRRARRPPALDRRRRRRPPAVQRRVGRASGRRRTARSTTTRRSASSSRRTGTSCTAAATRRSCRICGRTTAPASPSTCAACSPSPCGTRPRVAAS